MNLERHAGEVLFVKTPTASYYFRFTNQPKVADVYRRGNEEQYAKLLGRRKLKHEGNHIAMFDGNDEPITAIIVETWADIKCDSIPVERQMTLFF